MIMPDFPNLWPTNSNRTVTTRWVWYSEGHQIIWFYCLLRTVEKQNIYTLLELSQSAISQGAIIFGYDHFLLSKRHVLTEEERILKCESLNMLLAGLQWNVLPSSITEEISTLIQKFWVFVCLEEMLTWHAAFHQTLAAFSFTFPIGLPSEKRGRICH